MAKTEIDKYAKSYIEKYTAKKICCATCVHGYYARIMIGKMEYKCPHKGCLRDRNKVSKPREFGDGWHRAHFYNYADWEPFHYINSFLNDEDFDI